MALTFSDIGKVVKQETLCYFMVNCVLGISDKSKDH